MALRTPPKPRAVFAVLQEREVTLGNEHGLNLSVPRQLYARARRASPDDARQILAYKRGWDFLSHAAKVASIGFGST